MIDAKLYIEKKEAGLIVCAKVGDSYAVEIKRFNEGTGEELPAEVQALGREQMLARKLDITEETQALDVILADMDALDTAQAVIEK